MKNIHVTTTAKLVLILLGLTLLFFILYQGRNLIIPIYIGVLFALLMLPFTRVLERTGFSRPAAASISTLVLFSLLAALMFFFTKQVQSFTSDLENFSERVEEYGEDIQQYLSETFNIKWKKQVEYASRARSSSIDTAVSALGSVTGFFIIASVIIPMTMFFLMAHRNHYKEFFLRLVDSSNHDNTRELLAEEQKIVVHYITGILLVVLILAVCNVTALTLFGLEHALLFGVLAAFLNIIPIVGTLIGSSLPVLYAFVMYDNVWLSVGVAAYFIIIQILESSIITPQVVGKRVKVNPYAILLAIFIGGELWGAAGMVLFIPMVAQLKMLCCVVKPLQPFGHLLSQPEKINKPAKK